MESSSLGEQQNPPALVVGRLSPLARSRAWVVTRSSGPSANLVIGVAKGAFVGTLTYVVFHFAASVVVLPTSSPRLF